MSRVMGMGKRATENKRAPDIVMRQVSFSFSGRPLFKNIDFTAKGGQWTCLLGPSGSGKSTLLRMISGSLAKAGGTIQFEGSEHQKHVTAWMSQQDLLMPWLSVTENVLLGARLRGEMTEADRTCAKKMIAAAGLDGYEHELPASLSGGMRQRVALLRTLMEKRPVILMDEPFSALDAITRLKLQNMATDMVAGATVLLVTHDPLEALRLGHRIYVMSGRPATLEEASIPKSLPPPPRNPADPAVTQLHSMLLQRLMGSPA